MATNPKEPTATDAVFAPFSTAWHLGMSILVLWAAMVAIHVTWVRWHHLEAAPHMEALIGYYVDQSKGHSAYVERIAETAYYVVFEATQAQRMLAQPSSQATVGYPSKTVGQATRRAFWAAFKPDLLVAGYATVLFGVKLGLVLVGGLFFAILMLAAGMDGFVQRYIRRACGGYESAALYHRAKLYGWRLLPPAAAGIFFCWPVAIDPAWIFLPTALASASLLRLQVTYYKKYL